jgi:hypothetical protein
MNGQSPTRELDRTVLGDLWKNTLSRIPTLYGRLVYLASLRDPDTGAYRHHGLNAVFGRTASSAALALSHAEVFHEWLCQPLSERFDDLNAYLASLDARRAVIVRNWRRGRVYRNSVPTGAPEAERAMFYTDMDALLTILKNSSGGDSLPPDSAPLE